MRISELATRSGVPVSTLRYYEAEGLLPASRARNGYRVYDQGAVDQLAFIGQAKSLSLPLAEIRELVRARDAEPCRSVRSRYQPMLEKHAAELAGRIAELQALRTSLFAAQQRLMQLPDRDQPCDAECAFLHPEVPAPPPTITTPPPTMPIKIDTSAIACSLDADDYVERAAAWRSLVDQAPRSVITDGLRFQLPISRLQETTTLAAAEQRCCAFYWISFDLHGATFDLSISAPAEAAGMLAELFGQDAS